MLIRTNDSVISRLEVGTLERGINCSPLLKMTQPNTIELAKQGDTDAITHILNLSLQNQGITTQVSRQGDSLHVVLESAKVTKQQDLATLIFCIFKEIIRLEVNVRKLKLYKKQGKIFDLFWYKEIEIEPELKIYSSASEQSINTNIQSRLDLELSKNKPSEAEFKAALKKCSQTARQSYGKSFFYTKRIEAILKQLNTNISATIFQKILNTKNAQKFDFAKTLDQIESDIKILSEESLEDLVISLNEKRKHLKDFTVALFGRTKAGKSTLRETLTRGNGSTIGKGSQRTTRDVKEYCWQGLRLLDTPGIEAYKGDDDTQKANNVIDQSDIVLFLTTDDSVQPGEFEAMAHFQKNSKYFAVILNVKHDISNSFEDLQMFIDIPEMVFGEERLKQHQYHIQNSIKSQVKKIVHDQKLTQHKHHIENHIQDFLNLDDLDIVCIHAQAGFLSTKEEYQGYSSQLWELSKIEQLYSLITYQIYTNGQKLRISTFSDSLMKFIVEIEKELDDAKQKLDKQWKFMEEQKQKLINLFLEAKEEGNIKIQSECDSLFNRIDNQIGTFVDKYEEMDRDSRKKEWQEIVDEKNIQKSIENLINEIFKDMDEKLKEFKQEYEYDANNINIDVENVKTHDFRKGRSRSDMNWTSVAIGAVGGAAFVAANWWNPGGWVVAAGWIATGVSIATKVAAEWKNREEEETYKNNIQKEKDSLRKQVSEIKQATIKAYEDCLCQNINKYENQVINQIDLYINGLFGIIQELAHAVAEIVKIKQEIETDFSNSQ